MDERARTIEVTVVGPDERAAIEAGLPAILRVARDESETMKGPVAGDPDGGAVVPIRGQGRDVAEVFFELANDLFAQIDVHGAGLCDVRLDGLLRADTGYIGWGYLVGQIDGEPPARPATIAQPPDVERGDDGVTLRIRLAR